MSPKEVLEIVSEAEQKVNINILFLEIFVIVLWKDCKFVIDGCTLMALLVTQISGLIKVLFFIPV